MCVVSGVTTKLLGYSGIRSREDMRLVDRSLYIDKQVALENVFAFLVSL